MDQGAPAEPVSSTRATGETAPAAPSRDAATARTDGLAPQVAAVEAARAQLGRDLDRLTVEVRGQMGQTSERVAWKAFGTGAAIFAAIVTRKLTTAAYHKARHSDPPANPAAWEVGWGEALGWSAATGLVVGIMRMIAARGAVEGWRRTLGRLPPDMQEVS